MEIGTRLGPYETAPVRRWGASHCGIPARRQYLTQGAGAAYGPQNYLAEVPGSTRRNDAKTQC